MKVTHLLAPAAAVMLAGSVTMGSMYVTISAAVAQADAVTVEGDPLESGPADGEVSSSEGGDNNSATAPADIPESVEASPVDTSTEVAPRASSTAVAAVGSAESDTRSSQLNLIEMYVSEDGVVNGRLKHTGENAENDAPVSGAKVLFLSQSRSPQSAVADSEGMFRVTGIASGLYTVCVSGDGAIAAFAVRVIEDRTGDHPSSDLNLSVSTVYSGDVQEARRIVTELNSNPRYQSILASVDSSASANLASRNARRPSAELSAERVFIDSTGAFDGEIILIDPVTFLRKPVSDMKLFCITDGLVREPVTIGTDGRFHLSGLSEGPCSLVAAGTDGVMALGVYLTTNPAQAGDTGSVTAGYTPVSMRSQPPGFRAMVEANTGSGTSGDSAVPDDVTAVPDSALPGGGGIPGGGTGAGAAGGGGGGFGAGGGLGGLLAAGAAGAIGFAIADNKNNPPATP